MFDLLILIAFDKDFVKLLAQWQEITRTCTVCGNALELVEHVMSTSFYCIC